MNLKLVHNDAGTSGTRSPAECRAAWSALQSISRLSRMVDIGGSGPRQRFAGFVGLGVAGAVIGVSAACSSLALLPLMYMIGAACGAGFMSMLVAKARSRRPTSWVMALDKALTEYEPTDRDAMLRLQGAVRERGYIDTYDVRDWLLFERYAVQVAAGWRQPDPTGFVQKTF